MTKEELKLKAEESFEQYKVTDKDYVVSPYSDDMGEKMLMFNYEYEVEEDYLRLYTQGYFAGAEPREKRIEELIALINAERERQEKCDDIHLRKIAELEKENAELKKKNLATQDAVTMQMYTNKANKEIADRQLTKAKEIIKAFLDSSDLNIKHKAEEFLGEF